jgi:proliferating cell nuclear antigen PCNA
MNDSFSNKNNLGYIFQAKTDDAYAIKTLAELLNNRLQFAQFKINENGIFLLQADRKQPSEQLIEISLLRENFSPYRCVKPLVFSINTTLFYKLIKCIKKKDSIKLYIHEDNPLTLGICLEQANENNKFNTSLKIIMDPPNEIIKPEGYDTPVIIPSKQYQKLKNLQNVSKTMVIISKLNYIKFFCDGGELYSRELVIGNENDEDNCHIKQLYKQEFITEYITGLYKCAGQSGSVSVYVDEENGLKIKMKVGGLGDLTVYIKSKELIEYEKEEKEKKYEVDDVDEVPINDMRIRDESEEEEEEKSISKKTPAKRTQRKAK